MDNVTLAQLRERARDRADMKNSGFIGADELDALLNSACSKLYDLIVKSNDEFFQSNPTTFTVTGLAPDATLLPSYTLPADYYRLNGVDVLAAGQWIPVDRFTGMQRGYTDGILCGYPYIRYRQRKGLLEFVGIPTGNVETFRLWYTPRFTDLSVAGDTLDAVNGWDEYVVVDAAILMKQKEETDTAELERELAMLEARIVASVARRDQSNLPTVQDVRGDDSFPLPGYGRYRG